MWLWIFTTIRSRSITCTRFAQNDRDRHLYGDERVYRAQRNRLHRQQHHFTTTTPHACVLLLQVPTAAKSTIRSRSITHTRSAQDDRYRHLYGDERVYRAQRNRLHRQQHHFTTATPNACVPPSQVLTAASSGVHSRGCPRGTRCPHHVTRDDRVDIHTEMNTLIERNKNSSTTAAIPSPPPYYVPASRFLWCEPLLRTYDDNCCSFHQYRAVCTTRSVSPSPPLAYHHHATPI